MATYRYIPEWMQARSEASHKAWESRWERAWELGDFDKLGPKGQQFIEAKYGTEIHPEEISDGEYDEYENPFDFELEY